MCRYCVVVVWVVLGLMAFANAQTPTPEQMRAKVELMKKQAEAEAAKHRPPVQQVAPTPQAFVPVILDEQKWNELANQLNSLLMPGPVYLQLTQIINGLEVRAQQEKVVADAKAKADPPKEPSQ